MTDKEKIRAYIEKLHLEHRGSEGDSIFRRALRTVLFYIDSMKEEPKECMYSKGNYTDEDRQVLCDGCEEDCKYNKKEDVSDDFTKALAECIHHAQGSVVDPMAHAEIWKDELIKLAKSEEPVSKELEKVVEEIVDPTVLNAYGTKELARRLRNTIYGTSVSEDLGEYINELSKQFPEVSFAKLSRIAVRVAKWQKQQDQSTIELAEDHAMLAGMEKMKEQLITKAVDVTVHMEAGNYPYIPQIELYDYDKDIPLAKEGDKYKVILIKED